MIDWLKELDKKIFLFIHDGMSNPFFDFIMPWIRDKYIWIPLYLIFIALMIYHFRKKSWLVIIVCLATVGISDFISSGIFKPVFHRLRPCQNPELALHIHHIIDCGGGFSFISSHAANHFALAIFLGMIFRNKIKWLLPVLVAWASVICFAQVYIAYHYPSDVVCGALLGISAGFLGVKTMNYWLKKSSSPLQ